MNYKPTALVIGPMKAGTTWTHDFLSAHGRICLPKGTKETFFFDRYYQKGIKWYESHFAHFDPNQHSSIVEIAPSYFHNPEAPKRIKDSLGEIPLILTLRDPTKRSWSHYLHMRRYGYTKASLQNAVEQFPEIIGASRYADCLQRWLYYFPIESIKAVWQEDLQADQDGYANTLCNILGISFDGVPEIARGRSNSAAMPASPELASMAKRLANILRSHRIYGALNFAKRLGFKKILFGTPGKRVPVPTTEELNWIIAQLAEDTKKLPQHLRHSGIDA